MAAWKSPRVVLGAAAVWLASCCLAQRYHYKGELFAGGGWGRVSDADEGFLGSGTSASAGIGYRPFRHLGFELEFSRTRHERERVKAFTTTGFLGPGRTYQFPLRYSGTPAFALVSALYHYTESRVQPYISGGAGLLHYGGSFFRGRACAGSGMFATCQPQVSEKFARNDFALAVAGGLKVFLAQKISLRPGVRYFVTGLEGRDGWCFLCPTPLPAKPERIRMLAFSLAVGYHW